MTTLLVGMALAVAASNMEPTMNFMIAIDYRCNGKIR